MGANRRKHTAPVEEKSNLADADSIQHMNGSKGEQICRRNFQRTFHQFIPFSMTMVIACDGCCISTKKVFAQSAPKKFTRTYRADSAV